MKKRGYATKMNLYIRILVAGYILYMVYGLIPGIQTTTGSEQIWMIIASVVLAFTSFMIIALSIKSLVKKQYYDPSEIQEMEEENETEEKDTYVADTEAIDAKDTEAEDTKVEDTEAKNAEIVDAEVKDIEAVDVEVKDIKTEDTEE